MLLFRRVLDARSASGRLGGLRRGLPTLVVVVLLANVASLAGTAPAAEYSTASFRVTARDAQLARAVALRAEELRGDVALEWLGRELPPWSEPCQVIVDDRSRRLSGDTTYVLTRGEVHRWRMELRGDPQRILEVLLPHEIVHTVFASHFRRPIPRWADEGAALSAEDESERDRLWKLESPRLRAGDGVPLQTLLHAREYPEGREEVRRFYVQGGSLTEFLLLAGKPEFIGFVGTGIEEGWEAAIQKHYGFGSIEHLEEAWHGWIAQDRPRLIVAPQQLLMSALHSGTADAAVVDLADTSSSSRIASRTEAIAVPVGGGQ